MKKVAALVLVLSLGLTAGVANAGFVLSDPAYIWLDDGIPLIGGGPSISADGLSLFFYGNYSGSGFEDIFPGHGGRDLYVATRPAMYSDSWTVRNLGATVNSPAHEEAPDISADGLTLFFFSDRSGGSGGRDLWKTTRPTTNAGWGEPNNLGPTVNSPANDAYPSISADGCTLYFSSTRWGDEDLWVTTRPTPEADWTEPDPLGDTVNSSTWDWAPSISADGRTLFFTSSRAGGHGGYWGDVWFTTRRSTDADWGEPVNLGPVVNSSSHDTEPDISPDGSALYFGSYRDPMWYIFEVSISLEIDFNGNTRIDFKDFCTLGRFWCQHNLLADICPAPVGDGVVDDQDMAVFAEHWLLSTLPPDRATEPDPPDGSAVAPLISDSNVYVVLDYAPGQAAIEHTGYFSENIDDVNNRVEDANLGSPPWPGASTTAFHVGLDHPDIPAFARVPLVRGKTYYWCVDEFDGLFTWPGQVWNFFLMPVETWAPSPADGETNVRSDPALTLSWSLGDVDIEEQAVHYIVYLGTDETAVTNADTASPEYIDLVEPTNLDVADLQAGTEHFWRVDTKLVLSRPPFTSTVTPGVVWSFVTVAGP